MDVQGGLIVRSIARWLRCLLALMVMLGMTACADDSNAICDKIYGDCQGALVDDQGGSISREACVRYFDKLAIQEGDFVAHAAECLQGKTCDEIPKYLAQGVPCP